MARSLDDGVVVDDADQPDDSANKPLFNLINAQLRGERAPVATGAMARARFATEARSGLAPRQRPGISAASVERRRKAPPRSRPTRTRVVSLREDVLQYLLRRAGDMPSLMSFLDELDRHSLETGREITLPMLREMAQPFEAAGVNLALFDLDYTLLSRAIPITPGASFSYVRD